MQWLAIRTTIPPAWLPTSCCVSRMTLRLLNRNWGEWPDPGAVETLVNVLRRQVAKLAASEKRSRQVSI